MEPMIRDLIPAADLASLTHEKFEELSRLDAVPATLCGPNLLHFHNQMREQTDLD